MFLSVKRFAKCCKLCFSSSTNFFPLSYVFSQAKKEFDSLTLSWWRSISDWNESICKLMEWFLCNRELRHERVKVSISQCVCENTRGNYSCKSHWHVLTQHKTYCYVTLFLKHFSLLLYAARNYIHASNNQIQECWIIFETKHSGIDQVKFVEYSLQKSEIIRFVKTDHITSKYLKAVFHKFDLDHSWLFVSFVSMAVSRYSISRKIVTRI